MQVANFGDSQDEARGAPPQKNHPSLGETNSLRTLLFPTHTDDCPLGQLKSSRLRAANRHIAQIEGLFVVAGAFDVAVFPAQPPGRPRGEEARAGTLREAQV